MTQAGRRTLADELRELSRDVRRLGNGFRVDPETIAIEKDAVAVRLLGLARELERTQ
jgi:hypothetical protein